MVPLVNKHRRRLKWAAIAVLAYTLVGFLILPAIVRWGATRQLTKLLDRPVKIAKLRLNPYTFSTTIRGFLIEDKDGSPFVSWDEVYVNFQLSSFFRKAWTFKEVRTSSPFVRVQVNPDYTLNFTDLIEKFSKAENGEAPEPSPSRPLALRVDRLEIAGARASFADLTTRTPFRRVVGPLQITLTQFHTDPDNRNPYAFAGTTDTGEKFSWTGHFFLEPIRSEGEFSIENLALHKYAPLYQDLVKFDIEDGVVSVRSRYRLEKSALTNFVSVTNTSVAVRSVKVKNRESGQAVAELQSFDLQGASVDVGARVAEVESISARSGRLHVHRSKAASINLVELARPMENATNVSGGVQLLLQSVTNAFAHLLASTNQWLGTLREFQLDDCAVQLDDQVNSRPVSLLVDDIQVAVRNLSNRPGTNLSAEVSLRWNTNGTLRTEAAASLLPTRAEINLRLEDIELRPLDPYLEPFLDVLILRSRLGLAAKIDLHQEGGELPRVAFRGDLRLDDLGAAEARTGADLLRWKSLRFSGMDANLEPPTFAVGELGVEDLFAHVIVETNGVLNLMAAAHRTSSNAPPERAKATTPVPTQPSRSPVPVQTDAVQLALPFQLSVTNLILTNGHVRFTDRTMSPNVDVSLTQLSGRIQGISSDPNMQSTLELSGSVENTGPVRVSGRLHPLFKEKATELKVSLGGMDLNPTGPYCGKFLGYRLTKGKLGLELAYEVRDGKVKGANLIKLDQFTLGEKVESPDALSVPIKLGIAILKDRNGLIELDVPVEGSLADPEFRLGKVISRAVVNVLTKIVTSPFAALGAVFGGGGEELSYQEFGPGSAELQTAAREKLDRIVRGLEERPGLQLEIEGAIDAMADGRMLRRQKLEGELRLARWQALGKSARAETSPDKIAFTPEEFASFVQKRYHRDFSPEAMAARGGTNVVIAGSAPASARVTSGRPAAASASPASPPEKGAVALRSEAAPRAQKAAPETMEDQVLSLVPLSESDYLQLATERAKRVRDYVLASGKVSSDRILMTDLAGAAGASKGAKVFLRLQ